MKSLFFKIFNSFLLPVFLIFFFFGQSVSFAGYDNDIDLALEAYQNMRFKKASDIAKKYLDKPLASLVYNLCLIYDKNNKNIPKGLEGLKKLYNNSKIKKQIWVEAALSYARVIQIFQMQNKFPRYKNIKIDDIYDNIIKTFPNDEYGCRAVVYKTESYFLSNDKKKINNGFKIIESFLKKYRGPERNTVPVHLYIEKMYINLRKDYKKSFAHLETAYKFGITSDLDRERVLFRLGRISEVKLRNKSLARKYYKEFLKYFQYSNRAALVKRYLKNLK